MWRNVLHKKWVEFVSESEWDLGSWRECVWGVETGSGQLEVGAAPYEMWTTLGVGIFELAKCE